MCRLRMEGPCSMFVHINKLRLYPAQPDPCPTLSDLTFNDIRDGSSIMDVVWSQVKLAHLMQRISLLHHLNHTPEQPSDNWTQSLHEQVQIQSTSPCRILSLRQERRIAEAFVLLASSSDDPKRVMAACVEEGRDGHSMTVKLAVNNGQLDEVRQHLQKMGRLLQQTNDTGGVDSTGASSALLRDAICLNQNRILCRIRSKHATLRCNFSKEKRGRPTWVLRICNTLGHLDFTATQIDNPQEINAIQSNVARLRLLYESLEALDRKRARSVSGLEILVEMSGICEDLHARLARRNLTGKISADDLQAIKKVSRYTTICKLLVKYSSQLPVFENIRFETIKETATSFPRTSLEPFVHDATQKTSRTLRGAAIIAKCQREGQPSLEDSISHASSLTYPVHAEIQLLFHYEKVTAQGLTPRLICSNKQACFLCNLFFRAHGRFLIPESHGRLYEKWAFPARILSLAQCPEISNKLRVFNQEIGNRINREIQLCRKPFKTPYESTMFPSRVESLNSISSSKRLAFQNYKKPDSNRRDSVVMDAPISNLSANHKESNEPSKCPSVQSPAPSQEALPTSFGSQELFERTAQNDPASLELAPLSTTSTTSTIPPETGPITPQPVSETVSQEIDQLSNLQGMLPAADNPCKPVEPRSSRSTSTSARSPSPANSYHGNSSLHSSETINLLRGTPMSKILPSSRRPLVVCAAKMRLTLFCPLEHGCSECRPSSDSKQNHTECTRSFFVCIEWLSHRDCAAIVRGGENQHIVDIDSLPGGLDVLEEFKSPNWPRTIYLKQRQELIRLAFTLVEEGGVNHQR